MSTTEDDAVGAFDKAVVAGSRDTSHVWGEFTESRLDEATILREILVYPGGRTSIHRHRYHNELDVVVGGAVEVHLGADPRQLETRVVGTGETFRIPAGLFHAVGFVSPEDSEDRPCARFVEVVHGIRSEHDIERAEPAVAGCRPDRGLTILDPRLIREGG